MKKTEMIIKALQAFDGKSTILYDPTNNETITFQDVIDYVINLQNENERLNDMKFTQEHCNLYEENEFLNGCLREQKAEIERLTEETNQDTITHIDLCTENFLLRKQNAELQKQVDELTDKLGKVLSGIKMDELLVAKGIEQAVKDTAKEIYSEIDDSDILVLETQEYGEIEVVSMERLKEIIKSKGVEVE